MREPIVKCDEIVAATSGKTPLVEHLTNIIKIGLFEANISFDEAQIEAQVKAECKVKIVVHGIVFTFLFTNEKKEFTEKLLTHKQYIKNLIGMYEIELKNHEKVLENMKGKDEIELINARVFNINFCKQQIELLEKEFKEY